MANISLRQVKSLYYRGLLGVPEISRRLNVSSDVLYDFMKANNLPRRSVIQHNALAFHRKPLSFSIKKPLTIHEQQLKIAGLMLYWAEGASTGRTVDFANSNVEMIRLFLRFLRKIIRITENRIRIFLYCYSNQHPAKLVNFWSKVTLLPQSQFTQPYVRHDYAKKGRQMPYGLIHIRYSDKKLHQYLKEERERFFDQEM